jgi:hypothetical protein
MKGYFRFEAGLIILGLAGCIAGGTGLNPQDLTPVDAAFPDSAALTGFGGAAGSKGPANEGGSAGSSGSSGYGGAAGSSGASGSTGSGGRTGVGGASGGGGASGNGGRSGSGGSAGASGLGGSGTGGNPRDAGGSGGGVATDGGARPWRPFNDTSPWNTVIASNAAVDPNSATLIADFSSISGETSLWINLQQFSVPVYFVDSTTAPKVTVRADLGGTGFRTGAASDSVAAGSGSAPIPTGATPAAGSDRHLSIIDRATNMEWGFWDANSANGSWTAGEASTQDLGGSGVRPPERSSPWWAGHGPRACGFGLIAGLITADEIRAGTIEHALVLAYPHIRSSVYTPPASSAQGTTTDALPTRGILCGGRIQLDPALDVTTLGLSPAGVTIARALQRYGAYIGDFSGAVSIYAEASSAAMTYFGGGVLNNNTASKIPLNRFRVLTIGTTYNNGN